MTGAGAQVRESVEDFSRMAEQLRLMSTAQGMRGLRAVSKEHTT